MRRTHILTFSVACLVVSVGCVIAAVIVVQKNDIVTDVDNQDECEASIHTAPPGVTCQKWRYNSCMKGKLDSNGNCKVNTDSAAAILMIVSLVGTILWITSLVWGLSMPIGTGAGTGNTEVPQNVQESNVTDETSTVDQTLAPATEESAGFME